jgi:hypothetical protein
MDYRLNTEPDYREIKRNMVKDREVEEFNIFWN